MFAFTIRDFLVVTSLVIQFYFTNENDAVVVVVIAIVDAVALAYSLHLHLFFSFSLRKHTDQSYSIYGTK